MGTVLDIAEWAVWGFSLLLALAFLMKRHADGGVAILSRRFAILVLVGVLVTLATSVSKLHLIWWMPIVYFLNLFVLSFIFRHRVSSFEKGIRNTDRSQRSAAQEGGLVEVDDDEYSFATRMVAAYAAVSRKYLLYRIVDESRLPFGKNDLKAAIELLLYYQETESGKEALRECYYLLSKYQPESETLENVQRITIEAYEKLVEHNGTTISEDDRMAGLLAAVDNNLEHDDTAIVDSERELLEAELTLWETKLKLEEVKVSMRDQITALVRNSNDRDRGDATDVPPHA